MKKLLAIIIMGLALTTTDDFVNIDNMDHELEISREWASLYDDSQFEKLTVSEHGIYRITMSDGEVFMADEYLMNKELEMAN